MRNAMKKLLYILIMTIAYSIGSLGFVVVGDWIMDKLNLKW